MESMLLRSWYNRADHGRSHFHPFRTGEEDNRRGRDEYQREENTHLESNPATEGSTVVPGSQHQT